jgi:signal transduction histidine kinase
MSAAAARSLRSIAGTAVVTVGTVGILSSSLQAAPAPPSDARTALVLYSDPGLLPATAAFTNGLREGLEPAGVAYEVQYLDISRFAGDADQEAFAQWLIQRYRDRAIPVVVAMANPASLFAMRFGTRIWPTARVVHAGIDGEQLQAVLERGDSVLPRDLQYRRTIEVALTLLPGVRQVYLVGGASAQDRRWVAHAAAALAPLTDRVRIVQLTGLRWQETLDKVSALPADSLAVPVVFFSDADDRSFVPADAVLDIAHHANRPAFVHILSWIGSGAVGGYVVDPADLGRRAAAVALRLLDHPGTPASARTDVEPRWVFDAAALQRWKISERSLPAGNVVINRPPSVWTQYRWYVLGALSLIALQSLLIGGLLLQRSRRRRAEEKARTSEAALRMSYERIRQLAGRLIGAQETARTRIARDLHDDVCQELASMSMVVADLKEYRGDITDTQIQQALGVIQRRTLDLVQGVRRLSHDLHPSTLRHVGLAAALEAHCIEVEQRYDVQVSFDRTTDLRDLPGDTALALFRIAQEALRNAATHGSARRVTLSIAGQDGAIELVVADDGKGFDREETARRGGGLGLVSMEERARLVNGRLFVVSAPGHGTTIRVRIPSADAVRPEEQEVDAPVFT